MREVWKIIKDYPAYKISNKGKVYNLKRGKLLKPLENTQGYLMVMLYNKDFRKRCYIHRFVLIAFRGLPSFNEETRHLDGTKTNNQLSNLKWGTKKENWKDRKRYGNNLQGEKNGKSKLKVCDVLTTRKKYNKGVKRRVLSERFKVSTHQISLIIHCKSWKHIA